MIKQKTTAHEHEDFPRESYKLLSPMKRSEDEGLREAIISNTISCSHFQLTKGLQINDFVLINKNKLNLNSIERRDFYDKIFSIK